MTTDAKGLRQRIEIAVTRIMASLKGRSNLADQTGSSWWILLAVLRDSGKP